MKKILQILLIVIVTILVLAGVLFGYLLIKNPLGLGYVLKSYFKPSVAIEEPVVSDYDHPLLNADQEQRIIQSGIDIEKIPTEITPEQINCGQEKIGESRALEIMNGAEPTPLEMIKILPCL